MQNGKNNIISGKAIKYIGFTISLIAAIYTTAGYIDLSSDASTRAYAPLVFIEGGFFVVIGLLMAWLGHRSCSLKDS